MYLDETILQSNTCMELVKYIKRMYEEPSDNKLEEDYIYIMKKARKALKRRSSGFKLSDIFKEDEFKGDDED